MKKIIILDHGGGRLANQLWNYISLYAYALEKGFKIENHCFHEYNSYFKMRSINPIIWLYNHRFFRENKIVVRLRLYRKYIDFISRYRSKYILDSGDTRQFYLPPTPVDNANKDIISKIESGPNPIIYTKNWMFRNPIGLQKYRKEITEYFTPKDKYYFKIESFIKTIRSKYRHVIGVHIRQKDYKTFKNYLGEGLYYSETAVRAFMEDFLKNSGYQIIDTAFVICSDDQIDTAQFTGLNIIHSTGSPVEDLFILSKTDCIIGSDSTFGGFASYYGNIPFIIFESPSIDWNYYKDRHGNFENKKSTVIFY